MPDTLPCNFGIYEIVLKNERTSLVMLCHKNSQTYFPICDILLHSIHFGYCQ